MYRSLGWGRKGSNKPGATVLQEARLPVISHSKCRQHMGSGVTAQMVILIILLGIGI